MQKAKYVLYILMSVAAISAGVWLAPRVSFTSGPVRYVGIVVFILLVVPPFIITGSVAQLLFEYSFTGQVKLSPVTIYTLFSKDRARLAGLILVAVFAVSIAVGFKCMFNALDKYRQHQIETYSEYQKVRIKNTGYKGKGSSYAFFDYEYNNELYTGSLAPLKYAEGDSVFIIFSTNDPEVVVWADEYALRKEK